MTSPKANLITPDQISAAAKFIAHSREALPLNTLVNPNFDKGAMIRANSRDRQTFALSLQQQSCTF